MYFLPVSFNIHIKNSQNGAHSMLFYPYVPTFYHYAFVYYVPVTLTNPAGHSTSSLLPQVSAVHSPGCLSQAFHMAVHSHLQVSAQISPHRIFLSTLQKVLPLSITAHHYAYLHHGIFHHLYISFFI